MLTSTHVGWKMRGPQETFNKGVIDPQRGSSADASCEKPGRFASEGWRANARSAALHSQRDKNPRYRISGPGTDVKNGHVLTAHHNIAQKLRARRLALLENRGAAGSHTAIRVARHTACCEGSKRMGARARESGCWRRNRSQESGKWKWRLLG